MKLKDNDYSHENDEGNQVSRPLHNHGAKQLVDGYAFIAPQYFTFAQLSKSGKGQIGKVADHHGKEGVNQAGGESKGFDEHIPAYAPADMADNSQYNREEDPPVVSAAKGFLYGFEGDTPEGKPKQDSRKKYKKCILKKCADFLIQNGLGFTFSRYENTGFMVFCFFGCDEAV